MIDFNYGVKLRRIKEEDLPILFKWRNDPRVWRWCRQYEPLHWEAHYKWFKWQAYDLKVSMFSIWSRKEDELLGACGLTDIDLINRRAEFSLYIDPDKQKGGYGKASLITLLKHGFLNMGLNRIWGESYEDNPALGVFKTIGFKEEGRRKEFYFRNGTFTDAILVSCNLRDLNNSLPELPVI